MAIYSHSTLLISMIIFFIFITTSSSAAHQEPADLAIEICKNTTDFNFCNKTLYSDPHVLPTADLGMITAVIFRFALSNATHTRDHIKAALAQGNDLRHHSHVGYTTNNHDKIIKGALIKCLDSYNKSSLVLTSMLEDFDSDTFYEFDVRSEKVEGYVKDCVEGLKGVRRSEDEEMSTRNADMLRLADICYVVSKLYKYSG